MRKIIRKEQLYKMDGQFQQISCQCGKNTYNKTGKQQEMAFLDVYLPPIVYFIVYFTDNHTTKLLSDNTDCAVFRQFNNTRRLGFVLVFLPVSDNIIHCVFYLFRNLLES